MIPHTGSCAIYRLLNLTSMSAAVSAVTDGGKGRPVTFIDSSDNPQWCEEVFELWKSGMVQGPYLSDYLLRHTFRTEEVLEMIVDSFGQPTDAALLAMEYAPHRAMEFVRKALRWAGSDDEGLDNEHLQCMSRWSEPADEMFSTLAVIDLPWTRRELLAVLSELTAADTADRKRALPIVLAPGESADEECRDVAASWEPILVCDKLPTYKQNFQEMISTPSDRITKVWHWRPMEES